MVYAISWPYNILSIHTESPYIIVLPAVNDWKVEELGELKEEHEPA